MLNIFAAGFASSGFIFAMFMEEWWWALFNGVLAVLNLAFYFGSPK